MNSKLTFINPRTYSAVEVRVGIDHIQILAGFMAALLKLYVLMSGETFSNLWLGGLIMLAHVRLLRHVLTLPVLGSLVLALMSFGMSLIISGLVIRKMVAQQYRDAGWKIRNKDGGIGEYSSRFVAIHEFGFHESDMTGSTALSQH